jgi:hypothetical protein
LVVTVLEGEHIERKADVETARRAINKLMKQEKTKGFAEVIVARSAAEGISYL